MPICECGCSQSFERVLQKGSPKRFIPGHQLQTAAARINYSKARPKTLPPADYPTHGFCLCGCGLKTAVSTRNIPGANRFVEYPRLFIRGHNTRLSPPGKGRPVLIERRINPRGYVLVYCPEHPNATNKFIPEHRLAMERALGRVLLRTESVHHINGDKQDNRRENLQLMAAAEHARHHRGHGDNHPAYSAESNAKRRAAMTGRIKVIDTDGRWHFVKP